jgi:hypothetical protein
MIKTPTRVINDDATTSKVKFRVTHLNNFSKDQCYLAFNNTKATENLVTDQNVTQNMSMSFNNMTLMNISTNKETNQSGVALNSGDQMKNEEFMPHIEFGLSSLVQEVNEFKNLVKSEVRNKKLSLPIVQSCDEFSQKKNFFDPQVLELQLPD